MSDKKLILMDVDKTIFESNYKVTATGLPEKIAEIKALGWQLGLHSDSGVVRLKRVAADDLNLRGLIIAERSNAIIDYQGDDKIIEIYRNTELLEKMQLMKLKFYNNLLSLISQGKQYYIITADNADVIKTQTVEGIWIFINSARLFSFSFLPFILQSGKWQPAKTILDELAYEAREFFQEIFSEDVESIEIDYEYNSCIIHAKGSSKKTAVPILFDQFGYEKVYMIGDSMSDWLNDSRVVQCAVGNAKEAYKEKCSFTSKFPVTLGVIDCLNWIKKQDA